MLILRGGTLIDGTGRAPVRDATIVITDERLETVTTGASATWPSSAEVIDVAGMTVLPGLIDCHDHLAFHGYELASRWELNEPGSTRHLRTARVIEQTLGMGYTAIRDAGGLDAGFVAAIDEGLLRGPRLLSAIAIISPIGGIGDRVSPSGHECLVPSDPALPRGVANGVEDVRRVVRVMIRAGADVIKCATTGGASSRAGHGPKDPAFDAEEMRALVDEAHAQGRKVMCHALGGPGLRLALAAGVDFVAGTDAGGHGHPPNAAELEHLVAAGLTPMQAIQAATSIAAECLGLEREIGTVEKAKRADLVVVAGDPLADVRVLQAQEGIRLVVKDGAIAVRR